MLKTPNIQNSKNPNKSKVKNDKTYDLETRLREFFIRVIKLCKRIPANPRLNRIISQIMTTAGSIGANYAEASEAMSKRDFIKSIKISRKESKEARVWLYGLKEAVDFKDSEFDNLIQESTEFIYIFTSILKSTDK